MLLSAISRLIIEVTLKNFSKIKKYIFDYLLSSDIEMKQDPFQGLTDFSRSH